MKPCSLLRTRYCRLTKKRRRDASRTRIKRRMKKGRMIVLKVERKAKKVRKSKRRIAGLFLKAEKEELSSCLKEGRHGRRMKTGKGNSGEDSGAPYQG